MITIADLRKKAKAAGMTVTDVDSIGDSRKFQLWSSGNYHGALWHGPNPELSYAEAKVMLAAALDALLAMRAGTLRSVSAELKRRRKRPEPEGMGKRCGKGGAK